MSIRPARPENLDELLGLNQSEVPHVGDIDAERMKHLFEEAAWLPLMELEGCVAGYVICLDQSADYASPNFLWFQERYKRFFYIDRIVVSQAFRRRGVARQLYDACMAFGAAARLPVLALEYNIEPPNPVSAAFHAAYGFDEVGRRRDAGTTKEVSMQIIALEGRNQ